LESAPWEQRPRDHRLVQITDEISEHADNAAQTFSSVNEALMTRLSELTGKKTSSGSQSREKSSATSAS
jgi:hypothetical protein